MGLERVRRRLRQHERRQRRHSDLGSCSLAYALLFSQDLSNIDDPGRGNCQDTDSVCRGPTIPLTVSASTLRIPFSALMGGSPVATVDPRNLVTMQWQLLANSTAPACKANFTVKNVSFY